MHPPQKKKGRVLIQDRVLNCFYKAAPSHIQPAVPSKVLSMSTGSF